MSWYQLVRSLITARVVTASHVMALRRNGYTWAQIYYGIEVKAVQS